MGSASYANRAIWMEQSPGSRILARSRLRRVVEILDCRRPGRSLGNARGTAGVPFAPESFDVAFAGDMEWL
jgi:hypothetical protein